MSGQGTYKRCATYRCRKKALASGYCADHDSKRLQETMDANPALTKMIRTIVDNRLKTYGLI